MAVMIYKLWKHSWPKDRGDGETYIGITDGDLRARMRFRFRHELQAMRRRARLRDIAGKRLPFLRQSRLMILEHVRTWQQAQSRERVLIQEAKKRGETVSNDGEYAQWLSQLKLKSHRGAGGAGPKRKKRAAGKTYPVGEVDLQALLMYRKPTGGRTGQLQGRLVAAVMALQDGEEITTGALMRDLRCSRWTLKQIARAVKAGEVEGVTYTAGKGRRPSAFKRT